MEHPEGGRFRRIFKSSATVVTGDGRTRSALTHIYYSLTGRQVSRFHRVASDEIWNLYRGEGLRLYIWDGTNAPPECHELSAENDRFCHVVPAGAWQAAGPMGDTVLVGCSVGPGFEYEDFELMEPGSPAACLIRSIDPALERFVHP